jgi:hypothetical protein
MPVPKLASLETQQGAVCQVGSDARFGAAHHSHKEGSVSTVAAQPALGQFGSGSLSF